MATKRSDAHAILNSFRTVVKCLRLADRAGIKQHGLGASQVFVLHELKRDAPLSINELAERTFTDQSTVSVVVSKLIEKGLVTSERAEDDARRLQLTLTAKGHLVARDLPPPIQHVIIQAFERLPPPRAKAVADALHEVCEVLGADDSNPPMLFAPEPRPRRSASRKTKVRARR